MELIIVITLLSFSFSYLPACSSSQIQFQPSFQLQDDNIGAVNTNLKLSLPAVPRKLRFTEKVKEDEEARDLGSHKQDNSFTAAGKQYHRKQNMVLGKKGTKQEWMEVDDPSQYLTIDYTRVRRRRPIHNKNLPVGP